MPTSHHLDRFASEAVGTFDGLDGDNLLTTKEAARVLRVAPHFLALGRISNPRYGPAPTYISARKVLYRVSDLRRWLAERAEAFDKRNGG